MNGILRKPDFDYEIMQGKTVKTYTVSYTLSQNMKLSNLLSISYIYK